jgi:2-hydroxychromene-2-carboxylate isomerase
VSRVEFFFDLSSPYSYLAATQMEGLAARTGATVEWKPFVLGAVFKATGNNMPAAIAVKGRYMNSDLKRWAEYYNVPFKMTSQFPVNAIKPERLIIAAGDQAAKTALIAFHRLWVDDADITSDEGLRAIADAAGLDAAALAAIESQPIKDQLRANTDSAIARGAFGAPAIFVDDQLFWGNDRLQFVERALQSHHK